MFPVTFNDCKKVLINGYDIKINYRLTRKKNECVGELRAKADYIPVRMEITEYEQLKL